MDRRLLEFIHLFNQKHFFEAHEILEELWLESKGDIREFYKGLIQCSVAFAHVKRGNFRGARNLYERAAHCLESFLALNEGINTKKLLQEVHAFFASPEKQWNVNSKKTPRIKRVKIESRANS